MRQQIEQELEPVRNELQPEVALAREPSREEQQEEQQPMQQVSRALCRTAQWRLISRSRGTKDAKSRDRLPVQAPRRQGGERHSIAAQPRCKEAIMATEPMTTEMQAQDEQLEVQAQVEPNGQKQARPKEAAQAGQPAGVGQVLGGALQQQITQALQPVLKDLQQQMAQAVRQQMEQELEPVRQELHKQVDEALKPVQEELHKQIEQALEPMRQELQKQVDQVLQQEVEAAISSLFR